MKYLLIIIALIFPIITKAQDHDLSGHILLQVEDHGKAWYLNPGDNHRYFLDRPKTAFEVMRELGIGITNANLSKIPIGILGGYDTDHDGLPDNLEKALNTDKSKPDTDNDEHSDYTEIINSYDPLSANTEKLLIDTNFTKKQAGKIFLATEQSGEAWYINPKDLKRYYLGKPTDAFQVMQSLSTGINNTDIAQIPIKELQAPQTSSTQNNYNNYSSNNLEPIDISQYFTYINNGGSYSAPSISQPQSQTSSNSLTAKQTIDKVAQAIKNNKPDQAAQYFTQNQKKAIKSSFDYFNQESRQVLYSTLKNLKLKSKTNQKTIYTHTFDFNFGGQNHEIEREFVLEKKGGEWVMQNI